MNQIEIPQPEGIESGQDFQTLVARGYAPYMHDEENDLSFFAVVQDKSGESHSLWGENIKRGLEENEVEIGDEVALTKIGKAQVSIKEKQKDGTQIERVINQSQWKVQARHHEVHIKPAQQEGGRAVLGAEMHPQAAQCVSEGRHSGKILAIEDGQVVQKIGRDPDVTVRHDISKLSRVPEVGAVEDISYDKSGRGIVKEKAQELSR